MQFSTLRNAAIAIASLGLLAACDKSEDVIAPQALSARPMLALEVSDASAASGQRIAISIANISATDIGGVQGSLAFDPAQLHYRGQLRDASSSQILLVNDKGADRGEIRLAVLEAEGMDRTASMVFDVIGTGYASSLSFKVQEAALNGSPIVRVDAKVASGVSINASLDASVDAVRLSVQDWSTILTPRSAVAFEPGEVRNGLKFGDTNFDGVLSLSDALYVINVSVGINEMIIGTDGTGPVGDRDAVVAGNVFPFNAPGLGEANDATPPGLEVDGSRVASLGDGLAIINEFVGTDQPVVGEIIPGRPLAPATNRIAVTGNITANTTWTSGNIYELSGAVQVTGGATLTIEAGTRIEGVQGVGGLNGAAFYVARDGMINAVGTPLQPIVFTCVAAPVSTRFKGCWGGVSILGNASSNDGTATSPIVPGRSATAGCVEKQAEGPAGFLYGGCNDDDNSGTFKYVRIEYAGFKFTPTNELNGLALYGVGRGTTIDYIQVHAGLDDGIEMFGGTVNMKHIVSTANQDDGFDYTEGWNGKAQFVIVQHDSLDSDKGFENDNNTANPDALPRSTPTVYNVTLVGKAAVASTSGPAGGNSVGGLNVRVGAQPKYFNFLVQNFPFALDIDNDQTCTNFGTTGFTFQNSIFTQNGRLDASDTDPAGCGTEVQALQLAGAGNLFPASSPLLLPLDVMTPDFRPAFGTATGGATPPTDGFFDVAATYIGAVAPANATKSNAPWYSGWTRNWATATTP